MNDMDIQSRSKIALFRGNVYWRTMPIEITATTLRKRQRLGLWAKRENVTRLDLLH